jgi:hypothetical protein
MYGLDQVANFRDLCGDDEHPMKVKGGYLKRNIIYRTSHVHFPYFAWYANIFGIGYIWAGICLYLK